MGVWGGAYKAFMVADGDKRGCGMQPGVLHGVEPAPELLRGVVLQLPRSCSGPQVPNIHSHHKMLVYGRK